MDWQAAILIGVGYLAGIVTARLSRTQPLSTQVPQSDGVISDGLISDGVTPLELASPKDSDDEPDPAPAIQGTSPQDPQTLAYERLSQLERFKSGFLARSAHELRSPINSVIGLHQLILEGLCETPEEEKQFTGEAKEAAYKVLQLFDTIIAASKLDIGREIPRLEPIALASLFKTLQELTHMQAAHSNLRLTFKPTDLSVCSDIKWLQMMLISLIDDAITATKLGDITLGAYAEGDQVLLTLEADRPVSDLNVRLDTSLYGREVDLSNLSSVYLSTGLTLAIAQEMVTALNGELVLPAAEDTSIITIKLPIAS
ncbi:sensor histidine kinase [Leptothoe sp. PORK10 BA2]|uniref:sensor histidine kinase n=1 Tax=Leptothoe sp. PORK10 BA2 TaxID=3110254 RepID=UPI002B2151DC|nr:HAMP domain-containing sensor histidine kinase [Leptothoe sp. PORK10 BA2]MEA5464214.1 HAMP domain-containing sensor histidine kinase [Leptothoe sp. PORK10 BA2]